MYEAAYSVLVSAAAAFAIWLTVRIVNGQIPWKCGLWGALTLASGFAAFEPQPFNPASSGTGSPAFILALVCFVQFVDAGWPPEGGNQ